MSDDIPGARQYLTFHLGDEVQAIDIRGVREIIQHGAMTPVPLMPAFVRGVINLRGSVVPVIDLHARFGRAPAQVGKKTCVVIFDAPHDGGHAEHGGQGDRGERVELGLLVDAVSEVIEIDPQSMEPPPGFGTSVRREFIHAIARHQDRFVVVLEPRAAFDVEEMARLCEEAS